MELAGAAPLPVDYLLSAAHVSDIVVIALLLDYNQGCSSGKEYILIVGVISLAKPRYALERKYSIPLTVSLTLDK